MFYYAMKAAASSKSQLADRIEKFKKLKMEPRIELFLGNLEDIFNREAELIENCLQFEGCYYIVHFPLYDIKRRYIYDAHDESGEKIKTILDFCKKIKAKALIMHRCYGFNKGMKKPEAEEKFLEKVIEWDNLGGKKGIKILIENYGFVWLRAFLGAPYLISSLDHFFPWDIAMFYEKMKKLRLDNTGIMLDTAHAVLSSNMFNMLKLNPSLASDARFNNIYPEDLERKSVMRLNDFIFDFIDFFHVSDSLIWRMDDGIQDISKYLCAESLPLGKGNVDYKKVFNGIKGDKTIVMEIDPENGDHNNNISQLKAIEWFRDNFD